jgi:adenylate cyclase
MIQLHSLDRCFHGIVPGVLATCDLDAMPNVSYISQVHLIDERHVALSCQFFNKTRQNLDVNPLATLELYDPLTFEAYRLELRFLRSEIEGPLYAQMAARIQAIASLTGMAGVFKLRSADVFEVRSIELRVGYIEAPPEGERVVRTLPHGPLTEIRGLQLVSERVARACDLDSLLSGALAALDEVFGFTHGMIMMPEGQKLVAVASHGYGDAAIGAEVAVGDGLIGSVAATKRLVRIVSASAELRYGRAIRDQYEQAGSGVGAEIPLPRLAGAESQMAIPLLVQDRLVGVLALESRSALTFEQWHEAFLQVLANQIASGIDRMAERDDGEDLRSTLANPATQPAPTTCARKLSFCYYLNDDCVFVAGEYLIRNVPGKILWKILRAYQAERRTQFSNRELRLDPSLGLPPVKDNLESRLILLRKRLEQKCPEIQLVPTRRGRFTLNVGCELELVERETA